MDATRTMPTDPGLGGESGPERSVPAAGRGSVVSRTGSVDNNSTNSSSATEDSTVSSSIFGPREIGRVVPVSKPELGITAHTDVEFTLPQEYETYELLLETFGALENVHMGKDLTLLAEVIKKKFPDWDKRAQDLILLKLDKEERSRLEALPESKGLADYILPWKSAERRELRTELSRFDQDVTDRKKRIRSILGASEEDTRAQDNKKKFIQKIRKQYKWNDVSEEVISARLQAYISEKPEFIFGTVEELMHAYQFIEQVEKSVSLQAGYDITSGGTRKFEVDLSPQNIDRLVNAATDDRKKAALKDLGRRFALNNWDDAIDWATTTTTVGINAALAFAIANSQSGGVHPLVAGGIGAAAGVIETVVLREIQRKVRHWYFSFPEGGEGEVRTRFTLSFNPADPVDPARRDIGDTDDPIRQLFRGRAEAASSFLQRCENFRVDLANGLNLHSPDTLNGWLDLSDRVLGEATIGTELPHRLALAHKIEQILAQQYPNETGGHKKLGELELRDRRDVINRATDINSQVGGGEVMSPIIKDAMLRRANGEPLPAGVKDALTKLAQDIKAGKKVFHPKEGPITLEEKEHELQIETARRDRQNAGHTTYTQLLESVKNSETALRTSIREYDSEKRKKGNRSSEAQPATATTVEIPAVEATGEIRTLEEKIKTTGDRLEDLKKRRGSKQTGGLYDGIIGDQKQVGGQLKGVKVREDGAAKELASRQQEIQELKALGAEQIPDTADAQTLDWKRRVLAKIAILEDVTHDGSVKAAEEILIPLTVERESLEQSYRDLGSQIKKIDDEIDQLEKSGGELATLREQIQNAEEVIEAKKLAYVEAQDNLEEKIRERDELLRDIFGVDVTVAGFTAPSADSIADITKATNDKVSSLTAELVDLRKKKEAGEALTVSDEDTELARGLSKLAESGIYNASTFNALSNEIIDGNIKIEDLAKVFNDEGYHLLLKRLFGIDALSQGADGNYNLTTRLFSKGRLADSIMEAWKLDNRATASAFFSGDAAGLQSYQGAQSLTFEINSLNQQLTSVESAKASDWVEKSRELRRKINESQGQKNDAMAKLYDSRLASLLAQDRVRTAQVLRKSLLTISQEAIKGNPFHEILTTAPTGPKSETISTDQGQLTLTAHDTDEITGILNTRGSVVAENMGNTGVSVELKTDNTEPEGKFNLSVSLNKDQTSLNILPDELQPNTPAEIEFLAYGDVSRRKTVVIPADFNQPIFDSIIYANRQAAANAGFPAGLLDIIYGPNPNDTKRDLVDIGTDLAAFDLATIPYELENFTASLEVTNYFYEVIANKRRTVAEINSFISTLEADRAAAMTAGYPLEVVDLIYKTDGSRKDPSEVNKLDIKRLGITDTDSLEHFISFGTVPRLVDTFYLTVGEGIGRLSNTDRLGLLKNKFTTVTIPGVGGGPGLEAIFENGEINIYYDAAGTRVRSRMIDFIRMTPQQANNVHPNIVAYINANRPEQQRLIQAIGKQAIEAMRKVV